MNKPISILILCLCLVSVNCSLAEDFTQKAIVKSKVPYESQTYYVNAIEGSDSNTGFSPKQAWKSLEAANKHTFKGGDSLLFKAGTSYTGMLKPQRVLPKGSETLLPVTIGKYGVGSKPVIHAQGKSVAAVYLHNTEGWHVSNLTLSNKGEKPKPNCHGIWVHNQILETVRDIKIEYLDVSNVYGTIKKGPQAGTAILVSIDRKQRRRFVDLLISHNTIKNSQRNGIIVRGAWQRKNRFASTNVVISHNLIEGVGGDGIISGGTDGALVEWNVVRQHPYLGEEGGAAAGIWPFASDNTTIQFNEVDGQKSWVDGQAYDSDYNCRNNTFQYNLSTNNRGGFMLLCSPNNAKKNNNSLTLNTVIKFNLSINDGYRTTNGKKEYFSPSFNITGGGVRNNEISNNILIIPPKTDAKMDKRIINWGNWGGQYPSKTRFYNNVVWAKDGHTITHDMKKAQDFSVNNNQFIGEIEHFESTKEVQVSSNVYTQSAQTVQVKLAGTKEELQTFKEFLEQKGNPHEAAGLKIIWP